MLARWREMVAQDREHVAFLRERKVTFTTNGVDTTEQDLAEWEARADRLDDLIKRIEAEDA